MYFLQSGQGTSGQRDTASASVGLAVIACARPSRTCAAPGRLVPKAERQPIQARSVRTVAAQSRRQRQPTAPTRPTRVRRRLSLGCRAGRLPCAWASMFRPEARTGILVTKPNRIAASKTCWNACTTWYRYPSGRHARHRPTAKASSWRSSRHLSPNASTGRRRRSRSVWIVLASRPGAWATRYCSTNSSSRM
jgi:hypothetical protein